MTENKVDINSKVLINLVHERPVLWDKSLDTEKCQPRTFEAWREVFCILKKDFVKMPFAERNAYGITVIKQWTSLRESWMKFHKRVTEKKVGHKAIKKFFFYDDMKFLTKNIEPHMVVLEIKPELQSKAKEKHFPEPEPHSPKAKKKKEDLTVEVDPNTLNYINNIDNEQEGRAMSFFKGIAPSIDKFTDEEMVEFQHEVTKVVMQIQKNRHLCSCFKRKEHRKSYCSNGTTSNSVETNSPPSLHIVKVETNAKCKSESSEIIDLENNLESKSSSPKFPFFLNDCYTLKES